jgi:hypothetical protein
MEQQRQLCLDIKDVFGTDAGGRVLAWWRRQARHGHAVLIPGDSHATHFYLGRQADVNAVVEILRRDLDELLAEVAERMTEQDQARRGGDPLWQPGARDDFLYPKEP